MLFFNTKALPFYLALLLFVVLYSGINQRRIEALLYEDYCVHPNLLEPDVSSSERISQIIHISFNLLDKRLIQQVTNWNAPISLSVVLSSPSEYFCAIEKLKAFRNENKLLEKYLRVHFVFPKNWTKNCKVPEVNSWCPSIRQSHQNLATYPVNIARNIARKFSNANYILIADYEHQFSENFEEKVLKVAKKSLSSCKKVLVYRIFEVEKGQNQPKTKQDLKELFDQKKAVVFHAEYYKGAHEIPHLEEWFNENSTAISQVNMKYSKHVWEPQFVSRNDIPFHDTNFPFLVRDNTVLRWELCRSGYQFDLLGDVFMFHMGIKTAGEIPISRKIQQINHKRFLKALGSFNKRMNELYPETSNYCPKFQA